MEEIMSDLGTYLQEMREKAGLSQKSIANKLGYTTPQFISNWERGISTPPPAAIRKLAKLIHIDSEKLFETILSSEVEDFVERRRLAFKRSR